jgi:hypothetical protein
VKPINEMTNAELIDHVRKCDEESYGYVLEMILADRIEAQSKREAELVEALKAEEDHQQALRNFQSISDPLDDRLLGMKNEVDRTRSVANMLRKQAIASSEGK